MKKCDIIIPVYNAYDYVEKCVQSILKNTDMDKNRLILIDDCSPDKRIRPLLKKFSKENKNIIVIENEKNLGFVGTVNVGMKYSDSDVLLLNSDTEVTSGWLKKIQKCAYSQKRVATVTPISNNATFASAPKMFQPNDLPKDMSLDEYASLIEKCSFKDYPELPTCHGFCLYITREALNEVGYFDEETFGKGYGEENDFSFRCLDQGFKNLLCDDTFIFHKESQSFLDDKEKLNKQGQNELKRLHPNHQRKVQFWCEHFPLKHIFNNIMYSTNLDNRENVLFLIHDWKDVKNNHGGTTLHVYDLIRTLRHKFNFHVLAPEDGIFKLYSYFKEEEACIELDAIDNFTKVHFYNNQYKKMLENIVETFDIKVVHIHHLIGHYFDIADVIKEKGLYGIMTLHDFYSECPLINKLYDHKVYCEQSEKYDCQSCLRISMGMGDNFINSWRKEWKSVLDAMNVILTPSDNAKNEVLLTYPDLSITTIEHGIDIVKKPSNLKLDNLTNYNIAFVGAIGPHKGNGILEELVSKVKGTKIKIHLFGICSSEKLKKSSANFIHHGKYKREDLPKLLKDNNINLVCSFSIWPETYSYTLTEIISCGVPVLAIDLGAVSERIKKYNLGWLIPLNTSANKIIEKINEIFNDKPNYDAVIKSINKYKIKTTAEMSEEYIPFYSTKSGKKVKYDEEKLKLMLRESNREKTTVANAELNWVLNSLKWRVVSRIEVPKPIRVLARKFIKDRK